MTASSSRRGRRLLSPLADLSLAPCVPASLHLAGGDSVTAQLGLTTELARCIGCGACEAGCKLDHHLGSDQFSIRIFTRPDDLGRLEFVKAACQQCQRPACMQAWRAHAVSKSPLDGIVTIVVERCAGCQECVRACP